MINNQNPIINDENDKLTIINYISKVIFNKKEKSTKAILIKRTKTVFINCTPHDIHIMQNGLFVRVILKSGYVARVKHEYEIIDIVDDIRVKRMTNIRVIGLPKSKKRHWYIVSSIVARCLNREDLIVPVTVKDEIGRIVGASSFIQASNFGKLFQSDEMMYNHSYYHKDQDMVFRNNNEG